MNAGARNIQRVDNVINQINQHPVDCVVFPIQLWTVILLRKQKEWKGNNPFPPLSTRSPIAICC